MHKSEFTDRVKRANRLIATIVMRVLLSLVLSNSELLQRGEMILPSVILIPVE